MILTSGNMFDGYTTFGELKTQIAAKDYEKVFSFTYPTSSQDPAYKTVYRTESVWVPPVEARPGVSGVPATVTSVKYSKNKGWNTWARSIEQLTKGKYYVFTCDKANEGLCLGLGTSLHIGKSISMLPYALIADITGIRVYERGVVVSVLSEDYSRVSEIKIFYQEDSSIIYVVTTGSETYVYTSLDPYTGLNAYIYGYIYSSDDEVLSSEYKDGIVQYGSV